MEVILQEQFPTTSGPVEDTAHIPEHRHSAPRYLRQPSTQVLEVSKYSGTQVHGYSGTHVLEVSKYSSAQCSVVLAPSHHLCPGGNCSWYVSVLTSPCNSPAAAAFSFPFLSIVETIAAGYM